MASLAFGSWTAGEAAALGSSAAVDLPPGLDGADEDEAPPLDWRDGVVLTLDELLLLLVSQMCFLSWIMFRRA